MEMIDIYIKMIDGTTCWVPAKASLVKQGQYQISECKEFDTEDSTALLEYLPGDIVQIKDGKAISPLSSPNTKDRLYWRFLFELVAEEHPISIDNSSPYYREIVNQIYSEIRMDTKKHYPIVKEWIKNKFKA